MNISQIQCLVALADLGSFTEAAHAVNLTQSAVSHALAALERELGVTLLERNRKGVVALTEIGQTIIPHARAMLASVSSIEQEARAAHGQAVGRLRLGSTESIVSPGLLAGVLTRFRAAYPDIEVALFEGAMREVGDWIEHSVVDVAFVLLPAPEFEGTDLTTDELCVLVGSRHRLSGKTAVSPAQLRSEEFIMEKTDCALHLMKRAGFEPSNTRQPIRYQASNSATTIAMVREGLGITLVPRTVLSRKVDGVVALSLDPPQELRIGLVVRSHEIASPAAKLFVQTALSWMREQAPLQPYLE